MSSTGRTMTQDLAVERKINAFLRKIVFPQLSKLKGLDFVWTRDENKLDVRGIDVIIDGAYVDIKAHQTVDALHPQRFSFELQTRHRLGDSPTEVTEITDGWLLSKHKVTEKYLFCYYRNDSGGKISEISLLLVDKSKLLEMLKKRGFDLSKPISEIRRKSIKFSVQDNGSVKYYFPDEWNISLTHSLQLPEQPLNIIIKRPLIGEICDWFYSFRIPAELSTN